MHVSMKWLRDMVDVPDALQDFCDRLDLTGTGVEGAEERGAALDGIVVGHILTREPHPDSDHMWVTTVDVGAAEPLQIVCGAQNFVAGDKVPVAQVGTVMPGGIKIKKSKLRGVESCGMNCSERELGLGGDHAGLMILPADAPVGTPIAEYLGVADTVLDLEITPNRPDCLSMRGMAREVGAMYGVDWHYQPAVDVDEVLAAAQGNVADEVCVAIEDPARCARYTARVIHGVKVGPSPDWLAERVTAMGARSINNIVDISNYIMFELGQPLHTFDLNAFAVGEDGRRHVGVRPAVEGDTFTTLDGVERELRADMTMICDDVAGVDVALAGVMGGLDSEVTDATTDVLLESATFATSHTSRTSRNLALVSEASLRYERGVDAAACEKNSRIAAAMIAAICGGTVVGGVVDCYPQPAVPEEVALRPERLRAMVGAPITDEEIAEILTRLGCEVQAAGEAWNVVCPTFRPDLLREADLIEEVLRIWGMDRVPSTLPKGAHVGGRTPEQITADRIGAVLRAGGLNETMTYSFAAAGDLEALRMPEEGRGEAVELMNPLNQEQGVMRRSIIPGLLRSVAYNQAREVRNVHLYEIGRTFAAAEGRKKPKERTLVAAALAGSWAEKAWNVPNVPLDFFDGKGIVENLLRELCCVKIAWKPAPADATWLQPGRGAVVFAGGRELGWVGEIHPLACAAFDVAGPIVAFELDMSALIGAAQPQRKYVDVPTFPAVTQDMALVVDEEVSAERVCQVVSSAGRGLLESVRLFDVFRDPVKVGAGKKSLALSLTYRAADRTLTSEEVERAHAKVVKKATAATGGEIRS